MKSNKKPVYKYPDFVKKVKIKEIQGKRYLLDIKIRNDKTEKIIVILKNPSRATKYIADKTINNVSNYIYKNLNNHPELENIGSIIFLNLIPIYQTYSNQLIKEKENIFDNKNFEIINQYSKKIKKVIIAWGNHPKGLKKEYNEIKYDVLDILLRNNNEVFYIDKFSKTGNPKHGQIWGYNDKLEKFLSINNISINNLFWIHFSNHLISFRYKSLPKSLHFTIAFNDNSKYINLHLTKNTNNGRKPKIELIRFLKRDLEKIIENLNQILLNSILKKIDPNKVDINNSEIITNEGFEKIKKYYLSDFYEGFRKISEIKRKSRLKIKGNIEKSINKFSNNENAHKMIINQFVKMGTISDNKITVAFAIKDNGDLLPLIKIFTDWYEINFNLELNDILKLFIGEIYSEKFIKYLHNSISILSEINTYEESIKWNRPMKIIYEK